MRHRQGGMTFLGLMVIMAMAGVLVYAGIQLTPAYLNYMNVARTLQAVATESQSGTIDEGAIRLSLEKHWEIEDISHIQPEDVQIQKNDSGVTLHVAYDDERPFIANVSLIVHFEKTVKIQ
ncbi:MAG: DUF4845 domain-containing protein [Gammaproteobacteria bacterium]|nr:DUF4845 domain-containing protein [Gammaproteobacteria bacterium]